MVSVKTLFPARFRSEGGAVSSLSPPDPKAHYHVLIHAPGSAGETLQIALESLNRSGFPLKNKGRNFPPVRSVSQEALAGIGQQPQASCDAPIRPLLAHVSNGALSDELASVPDATGKHTTNSLP